MAEQRFPFPLFPSGWYCVGFSADLKPRDVVSQRFCGSDVVVFRTSSGEVVVTDAHCPHLGAHLGKGGVVEGEELVCPFHRFRFDAQGRCTGNAYGTKAPPRATLRTWEVREHSGLVMVWFDAEGGAPNFEVPALEAEGWTPMRTMISRVRTHPQETTENSVDLGHFSVVHGYVDVALTAPLHTDGPFLRSEYAFTRALPGITGSGRPVKAWFSADVWGLGYSLVYAGVKSMGLTTRLFVLPTPTDGDVVELRAALSVKEDVVPRQVHPALALLPKRWVLALLQRAAFDAYESDLAQDFDIWENKIYTQPAILAEGDGPIPAYRKWARQFYRVDELEAARRLSGRRS